MPTHACLCLVLLTLMGNPLDQTQPPAISPVKSSGPREPETRNRTGPEVDIRPKFVVGRQTRYELAIISGNKVKSDQQELNQDQTMTQSVGLALNVKSVDDEGATVELVYERIKVGIETDDYKVGFDSAATVKSNPSTSPPTKKPTTSRPAPANRTTTKPGAPAPARAPAADDPDMSELLAQIMRPMVGTTLTLRLDKSGNIKRVTGGDALAGGGLGALLGGLGGLGGGSGGAPSLPGGGGLPMPIAGGTGGGSTGGPGNPMAWMINGPGQRGIVHVGESWTNNDTLGGTPVGGFSMITKHTCKSAAEGGKSANFVFSGRADKESLGNPDPANGGFSVKEMTFNGDYTWDTAKGELKSMSSIMNSAIDGKVASITMSMSANTKITLRRLD